MSKQLQTESFCFQNLFYSFEIIHSWRFPVQSMAAIKSEFLQLAPEENVEVFKKSSVKRQWIATITMDLLAFSYGATCGWSSASIPILKSDDTPLDSGPISTDDASWIASGICIGGLAGNFFIGWASSWTRLFVCWLLTWFSSWQQELGKKFHSASSHFRKF